MSKTLTREKLDSDVLLDLLTERLHKLVVHNDEVNTFDWVIDSLVSICKHTLHQAEQCTLLIHFKGKCAVKDGEYEELVDMKNAFLDRGIGATVESC